MRKNKKNRKNIILLILFALPFTMGLINVLHEDEFSEKNNEFQQDQDFPYLRENALSRHPGVQRIIHQLIIDKEQNKVNACWKQYNSHLIDREAEKSQNPELFKSRFKMQCDYLYKRLSQLANEDPGGPIQISLERESYPNIEDSMLRLQNVYFDSL